MLANLSKTIANSFPVSPWSLQSIPGFPYNTYMENKGNYDTYQSWYDGTALESITVDSKGNKIEKYPIKLNPIRGTVRKHASVLFGTNIESISFGSIPVTFLPDITRPIQSKQTQPDETPIDVEETPEDEQEKRISKALIKVFSENGGGALFFQNGSLAQYMGGCVFVAKWRPDQERIEITNPNPKEFVGVPEGRDFWRLREAWIIQEMDAEDLLSYRLAETPPESSAAGIFYYIEHWTKTSYDITINGIAVLDENGTPYGGTHPWGMVPIVYIPHMRSGTNFLGESMVSSAVQGIIKEYNSAWADVGDAVNDDAHPFIAMNNVNGSPKTIRVDNRTVVDLGGSSGMTGTASPNLFGVKLDSTSEPMLKYGNKLETEYRKEVDLPAVADGEDEGSQRSSLTLITRMWSLVSHADAERVFWSVGLAYFAKILLTIMADKKLEEIVEEDINVPLIIQWRPMLPKDRTEIVNEIAIRDSTKTASKEHLMTLAGDIRDPQAEMRKIRNEDQISAQDEMAKTEQTLALNQKYSPKPDPAQRGGSSSA